MRITTKKLVNILVWAIAGTLWICLIVNFLTDTEIISATVGLVFISSLCLFERVHRSEPGQQVLSNLPLLLAAELIFAMDPPISREHRDCRLGFENRRIFACRIRRLDARL